MNFFTLSNKQWLLDQFKYCKWFIVRNSYEEDISKIPSSLVNIEETLSEFASRADSMKKKRGFDIQKSPILEDQVEKEWSRSHNDGYDINHTHINQNSDEDLEKNLKLLNLSCLIDYIVGFETDLRHIVKEETKNGKSKLSKNSYKKLKVKNQIAIKRFTSSNFSTNYDAVSKFCE